MIAVIDKKTLLLETQRLYLRPLKEDDITDEYVRGLNDPEVNRFLTFHQKQTRALIKEFVRHNWKDSSSILFGIFLEDDSRPFIGTIRLSGINWFHYFASIGMCIFAKRAWKKGYAFESLREVVTYAFNGLGLHYLEAGAYVEHVTSIKLFCKAGFSVTHYFKEKYRLKNKFQEAVYLGITNKDFDKGAL